MVDFIIFTAGLFVGAGMSLYYVLPQLWAMREKVKVLEAVFVPDAIVKRNEERRLEKRSAD